MTKQKFRKKRKIRNIHSFRIQDKGFTILEVLIVVIIIGVLVAVAISRYTQRTDEAKINTARSEMQMFAKAEQAIEIDTGYYVGLRVLNDVHSLQPFNDLMGWREYPIENEPGFAISTSGAWADIAPNAWYNYQLAPDWKGPYMEFKQKGAQSSLLGVYTNDVLPAANPETKYGIPLDPWGSPYRFYGPINTIRDNTYPYNYGINAPDRQLTRPFDRFAIVSYGKNTTLDLDTNPAGTDDIIVFF